MQNIFGVNGCNLENNFVSGTHEIIEHCTLQTPEEYFFSSLYVDRISLK